MQIALNACMAYGCIVSMKKKIAFIGDSYCARYGIDDFNARGNPPCQGGTNNPTHPDLVVKHFDAILEPYGFGGQSWWYSRTKFFNNNLFDNNIVDNDFEALIFFHTNCDRINNAWNPNLGPQITNEITKSYYKHIHCDQFNHWSQESWFREINRRFSHLKTIHFHCFIGTAKIENLLPGMVFKTPLIHISVGELTGSDDNITKQLYNDRRDNHFSEHNNRALAQVIIQALEHYSPGQYDIPIENFEIINRNATQWPYPGFGTE